MNWEDALSPRRLSLWSCPGSDAVPCSLLSGSPTNTPMGLGLHHPGDIYKLLFVSESGSYVTGREANGKVPLVCLHGRLLAADTYSWLWFSAGKKNQTFISRQDLYLMFGCRCASTDLRLQRGHISPTKHPKHPPCLNAGIDIALAFCPHVRAGFLVKWRHGVTPDPLEASLKPVHFKVLQENKRTSQPSQ